MHDGAHLGRDERRGNLVTEPGRDDVRQRRTERTVGHKCFLQCLNLATCMSFHDIGHGASELKDHCITHKTQHMAATSNS